jgi:hypothetical protein
MRTTLTDLRYGARAMARNPGFTAIAVLPGVSIGATTAIFSVVSSVLLRRCPSRSRIASSRCERALRATCQISFTYANFQDVRDTGPHARRVSAIMELDNVTSDRSAECNVASVTEGFFAPFAYPVAAGSSSW